MCKSFAVNYTNCGHTIRDPWLCQIAECRRPVYACPGWSDPLREVLQVQDRDCPPCEDQAALRTNTPWRSSDNHNFGEDVPIRSRRGSLPQRYVSTPPPANTRSYEYISGYGYGASESRGARGDPDPSQHEVNRRVSEWANRVPPGPPASSRASTERELYRPREHDRVHTISSSRRHSSAGVESHASRHHRRQSDIYDPRRSDAGHNSRAVLGTDESTNYIRASDEERRRSQPIRRPRHPPSFPSAAEGPATHVYDDSELTVTTTHIMADGTEVVREFSYGIEYQSTHPEDISAGEYQVIRRGRGIYGGSGDMGYPRGPQPPHPPRRI